jgi:hypothetical protein
MGLYVIVCVASAIVVVAGMTLGLLRSNSRAQETKSPSRDAPMPSEVGPTMNKKKPLHPSALLAIPVSVEARAGRVVESAFHWRGFGVRHHEASMLSAGAIAVMLISLWVAVFRPGIVFGEPLTDFGFTFFLCGFVGFPVLLFYMARRCLFCTPFLESHERLGIGLMIGLPIAYAILFVCAKDSFDSRINQREQDYIERCLRPMIEHARTLKILQTSQQHQVKPPLLVLTSDSDDGGWSNLRPYRLRNGSGWVRYAFRPDVVKAFHRGQITQLPDFTPQGVIIVAHGHQKSEGRIALDDGSVPQILHGVCVYAFYASDGRLAGKTEEIWGGQAKKPARMPGIHSYSHLDGSEPKPEAIQAAISQIADLTPWEAAP